MSAAKALTNRTNAQASTGPRTEEGRAAVRLNAVAHGMTSKTVVLPHESVEEYQQMHQGLVDSYNPANDREKLLVEQIAQAFWRLQRCYGVERAFLENRIAASEETDPDAAMANLFIDKVEAGRMRLLMRYITTAERAHNKALADLQKAQAERRKQEREEASLGFVSQPDQPVWGGLATCGTDAIGAPGEARQSSALAGYPIPDLAPELTMADDAA